jgi:hypothetical protein
MSVLNSPASDRDKRTNQFERMHAAEARLTAEYVRSILDYSPETGIFTWKVRADASVQWNGKFAGKRAGTLNNRGYRQICINGRDYYEHRVAYLIMEGHWPEYEIDHRDGAPADNRWAKLRPARHSQNCANRRLRADNTSGVKGVSWNRATQKWRVQVRECGKRRYLGYFTDRTQAAAAYAKAAREAFGAYARLQ